MTLRTFLKGRDGLPDSKGSSSVITLESITLASRKVETLFGLKEGKSMVNIQGRHWQT